MRSVGELRLLHDYIMGMEVTRGSLERRCTCGQEVVECGFWRDILAEVSTELGVSVSAIRTAPGRKGADGLVPAPDRVKSHLKSIFGRLREKTPSIIVDSSKDLCYLQALREALPDWRIVVVFMLRDPLAVARSQNKWRAVEGRSALPDIVLLYRWLQVNLRNRAAFEAVPPGDARFVRYEEFIRDPDRVLKDIACAIGVKNDFSLSVDMRQLHTIAGTPSRFSTDRFVLGRVPEARGSGRSARSVSLLARACERLCTPRRTSGVAQS